METELKPTKNNKHKQISEEEIQKFNELDAKIIEIFKEYYQPLLGMNKEIFEDFLKISSKKLSITFRINKI